MKKKMWEKIGSLQLAWLCPAHLIGLVFRLQFSNNSLRKKWKWSFAAHLPFPLFWNHSRHSPFSFLSWEVEGAGRATSRLPAKGWGYLLWDLEYFESTVGNGHTHLGILWIDRITSINRSCVIWVIFRGARIVARTPVGHHENTCRGFRQLLLQCSLTPFGSQRKSVTDWGRNTDRPRNGSLFDTRGRNTRER